MTLPEGTVQDLPPLIVTAHFDETSFDLFDGLRRRHFPSHLNRVPAHISLFHHLPGSEAEVVAESIVKRCRDLPPLQLQPAGVRFLGRGVALAYESLKLSRLRAELASEWHEWLTPQDRQPFKAHVTIQNKVEPAMARALAANFEGADLPPCRIDGISIWRYLAGPWRHLRTCQFGAP